MSRDIIDILIDIYEAEMYGDISTDERDFLITEMKSREEYAKRKFKEKYHYLPDKKHPGKGTITVDGRKHKVDIGNSKTVKLSGVEMPRSTLTSTTDGEISIGRNEFWKLKNQKRRDAILQHEIGHSRLHRADPENLEGTDKYALTAKAFRTFVSSTVKDQLISAGFSPSEVKVSLSTIMNGDEMKKLQDRYVSILPATKSNKAKLRDEAIDIFKKYEKGLHASVHEFEADRYSANKTSEKDLRRGVRESYKRAGKAIPKNYKDYKSTFNKLASEDMKQRAKALKDRDIQTKYKKAYY